jgi:uncharacterized membrane protein
MDKIKILWLNFALFMSLGAIYYFIEVLYRGYSHWSMFVLGGICGLAIGFLNEHKLKYEMPLWKQVLYGELIVLPLEFLTGCIVNLWLGWNIWDYSNLPFNILGQTSLLFAFLFIPVILLGIFIDDYYRWIIMDGEKPRYKLF